MNENMKIVLAAFLAVALSVNISYLLITPREGPIGYTGHGEKGEQGIQGKVGPQGPPGESIAGPMGPQGIQGIQGESGESIVGSQGIQGMPGKDGLIGVNISDAHALATVQTKSGIGLGGLVSGWNEVVGQGGNPRIYLRSNETMFRVFWWAYEGTGYLTIRIWLMLSPYRSDPYGVYLNELHGNMIYGGEEMCSGDIWVMGGPGEYRILVSSLDAERDWIIQVIGYGPDFECHMETRSEWDR